LGVKMENNGSVRPVGGVKKGDVSHLAKIGVIILTFFVCSPAPPAWSVERIDPHACAWFAGQRPSLVWEAEIERRLATPPPEDSAEYPYRLCILAELMKRTGDPRAASYYEQAIELNPEEPGLELIYGEYLQWLRGVRNGGMVVEAKEHYRRAKVKIANLKAQERWGAKNDGKTSDDLKKSLFYLNQANGIGLSLDGEDPFVFFSTITEARNDTVAFDYQWVDSRAFNAEALYSQSDIHLNRPLTRSELKDIARNKPGVVTANRLRFQLGKFRAIDLTYRYIRFNDAKIPDYNDPTRNVNDVGHEYGISFTNDFQLPYAIDLFLKGMAEWSRRTTVAENFNDNKDDSQKYGAIIGASRLIGPGKISSEFEFKYQVWDPGYNWAGMKTYEGRVLYQSRLFGTNRWILNGLYVFQDVDQSVYFPDNDNMHTFVGQANYVFSVPEILFGNNVDSGEVFGGYAEARSLFTSQSANESKRQEFFGGFALRRIEATPDLNPFDVTYRSSYYRSEVDGDSSQDHRIWRNQLTLGYRLVEDYQVQWLPNRRSAIQPALLNLEVPIRHDGVSEGLREFANYRIGLQLKGDFIFTQTPVPFPFYGTLGYAFERLYHLNQNFHILLFRLGTGF
jgi:hypothetical protein